MFSSSKYPTRGLTGLGFAPPTSCLIISNVRHGTKPYYLPLALRAAFNLLSLASFVQSFSSSARLLLVTLYSSLSLIVFTSVVVIAAVAQPCRSSSRSATFRKHAALQVSRHSRDAVVDHGVGSVEPIGNHCSSSRYCASGWYYHHHLLDSRYRCGSHIELEIRRSQRSHDRRSNRQ
jgi:hypothetical protein